MHLRFIYFSILIILFITSCVSSKNATYFNNLKDTLVDDQLDIQPLIQRADILGIEVSSLNPEASILFNAPNYQFSSGSMSSSGNSKATISDQSSGYLVDYEGNIQFPVLGSIKALDLTEQQLNNKITQELIEKKLLDDPIVVVRHINFKVTVLGEVEHPTVIRVC